MSNFSVLQARLNQWKDLERQSGSLFSSRDDLYGRMDQIFAARAVGLAWQHDFMVLTRHILGEEKAHQGWDSLFVPNDPTWPVAEDWRQYGFSVHPAGQDRLRLVHLDWHPDWLAAGAEDPVMDVYAKVLGRPEMRVPADPFYARASGFEHYSSPGQRDAIHALMAMNPGSTLVVNLPTGSGKSMLALLPALQGMGEGHLTLVIVPTVSLALDQQRQIHESFGRYKDIPLAWHAGIAPEEKKAIKVNIRKGRQPILFCSPEAVCGALRLSLQIAAEKGFLKYFIVDEAHLVAQWGDEFRPDFQKLAAVRRYLLTTQAESRTPLFRSVLMSATITEETLLSLESLFDLTYPDYNLVSAVHLRGEPRYWSNCASNESEKVARVLETLRMGPRPFILYLNRPEQAIRWLSILREAGFQRVETFHGRTPNDEREAILQKWSVNALDGIIATAAFGVGMDKGDIRLVLHACVPESLDRFYQEVGRGGRDGKASLSVLIYTDSDVEEGARLSSVAIIGEELGRLRWQAMFHHATRLSDESGETKYRLDLTIVPANVIGQSKQNTAWNLRTVLLLLRAKVIRLTVEPSPDFEKVAPDASERLKAGHQLVAEGTRLLKRGEEAIYLGQDRYMVGLSLLNEGKQMIAEGERVVDAEEEAIRKSRVAKYFNELVIELLEPNHLSDEIWQTRIQQERALSYTRSQRNFGLMESVLHGEEMGKCLTELYSIFEKQICVAPRCGSCPACRKIGLTNNIEQTPTLAFNTISKHQQFIGLRERLPFWSEPGKFLYVSVKSEHLASPVFKEKLSEMLDILVEENGLRELRLPHGSSFYASSLISELHLRCPEHYLIRTSFDPASHANDDIPSIQLPVLTLLMPWEDAPIPAPLFEERAHIIIGPERIMCNSNPHRFFTDTYHNHCSIEEFYRSLAQ